MLPSGTTLISGSLAYTQCIKSLAQMLLLNSQTNYADKMNITLSTGM